MNKLIVGLIAFLGLGVVHAEVTPYIYGGEPMGPKDIPFAVGIMIHRPTRPGWCGGALVSQNYVLTAATCMVNLLSASVLLGASDVNHPDQTILVESHISHPFFDLNSGKNDIALVKLSVPVNLSDIVSLSRLPSRAQEKLSFEDKLGTSYGWGKGGKETVPVSTLHAVNHTVINNLICLTRYPAYITPTNLCAGSSNGTPCTGDRGGAIFIKDDDGYPTQIGIFNYQFSLGCNLGWPAVYTRVTSYLDWIESNSDVVIREK